MATASKRAGTVSPLTIATPHVVALIGLFAAIVPCDGKRRPPPALRSSQPPPVTEVPVGHGAADTPLSHARDRLLVGHTVTAFPYTRVKRAVLVDR